jgi:hypothetical protein
VVYVNRKRKGVPTGGGAAWSSQPKYRQPGRGNVFFKVPATLFTRPASVENGTHHVAESQQTPRLRIYLLAAYGTQGWHPFWITVAISGYTSGVFTRFPSLRDVNRPLYERRYFSSVPYSANVWLYASIRGPLPRGCYGQGRTDSSTSWNCLLSDSYFLCSKDGPKKQRLSSGNSRSSF